ncbi:MAG TPA: hypothetical protein DCL40_04105 [Coxiellaceae bacterium]|nr:hypothetical protein [Coxiellaceae bacterium]|tara:strand:+ start:797 stop:1327 length:531 start_codon:yes stop_codon:yes gene_type:complete
MTQYELIPHNSGVTSIPFNQQSSSELAYEDDPATSVMQSLANGHTLNILESTSLDDAIQTMKTHHVTLMLVTRDSHITGILSSEDLLGEKPITLQQRSRIERENIMVKMLMTPLNEIILMDIEDVLHARVGNVIATLKNHHQPYAIVSSNQTPQEEKALHGIFSASQISKQLHKDI